MNERNKKELLEILKAGIHLRPIGRCDCCKAFEYVDDLQLLPEVDIFIRRFTSAQTHEEEMDAMELLNDEELKARYGYDSQNLFCQDCLQRLIAEASD